jgi:DNA-binding transcriptional regulator YiaG
MINQHGSTPTRVVDHFEATDLGAPFRVILHDAVKVTEDSSGETAYSIPDLPGLLQIVVITRVLHPRKLSGADIRFIRKATGMKQKNLAADIEVSAEHLSRCEAGTAVLSPPSEKLLRILSLRAAFQLHKIDPCEGKTRLNEALDKLFDRLKPVSVFKADEKLEFHFWRASAEGPVCGDHDDGRWEDKKAKAA